MYLVVAQLVITGAIALGGVVNIFRSRPPK
jgi:hypothetical protein